MDHIVLRRLGTVLPTLIIATIVVFLLIQLVPGNAALFSAGEAATKSAVAARRHQLGLDRPLATQYWDWLTGVVRGNLGTSLVSGEPVRTAIAAALPVTLTVVAAGLLVSVLLGVPAGILAGWRANRVADRIVTTATGIGVAVPTFWLGLILVSVFAIQRHWLPATGYVSVAANFGEAVKHVILPGLALGVVGSAEIARQLRSAMITALSSDSMRTLYAKGLPSRLVVWHAVRNSAVPLLTIVGLQVNRFLGASVIIESVFGLSGLGQLVYNATLEKDFIVIQGAVLVMAIFVIATNLVVDIAYRLVDPRIK
jgi:peptide/nickel transport system permease protein